MTLQEQIANKEIEAYVLWHQSNDAATKEEKQAKLSEYKKAMTELQQLENQFNSG